MEENLYCNLEGMFFYWALALNRPRKTIKQVKNHIEMRLLLSVLTALVFRELIFFWYHIHPIYCMQEGLYVDNILQTN